jgi:RNA polymerase subunit RPABC4/transcription elongation factor Spt4
MGQGQCKACSTITSEDARFCPRCGTPMGKHRTLGGIVLFVMVVLALFGAGFYLG